MNRYSAMLCILCSVLFLAGSARAQSKVAQFTGYWTLDREKTNTSKDFPERLKDFKMLVGEDQNRLMVKSQVEGAVEVRLQNQAPADSGVVASTASRTTTPTQNGVMATTAGSNSVSSGLKDNYGGTLALYFTPPEITYDLTGQEIKIEPRPGDKVNRTTRIRAKIDKDGKTLQLTTFRHMKGPAGDVEITCRETWRISEDGKSLKFYKTVESPTYRDEITMVMTKKT